MFYLELFNIFSCILFYRFFINFFSELRHGGIVNPSKSTSSVHLTVASSSKSNRPRSKTLKNINPVVKLERNIGLTDDFGDESVLSRLRGDTSINVGNLPAGGSGTTIGNINLSNNTMARDQPNLRPVQGPSGEPGNIGRIPRIQDSPDCNFLSTHRSVSHSSIIKSEIKLEDRLEAGLTLRQTPPPRPAPPSLPPPAPPEPQHTLPHPSPHAGPPPSIGPPSIGPPSIGPPSIGPPSIESQCVGPPSVGSHSIGPPSIGPPSCGPPSIGPPSIGPPSIGPPSVGPPSVGPPSVGSSGGPSRPSSVSCASSVHSMPVGGSNLVAAPHMVSTASSMTLTSQEEEVNRISAMLQKEVEALASKSFLPGQNELNSAAANVPIHDIVEAQGLAGGVIAPGSLANATLTNSLSANSNLTGLSGNISLCSSALANGRLINTTTVPATTPTHMVAVSQTMGSVPVPMSHMSIATLNQIQADLLATVSESDLNAVLNATPDNSDLSQTSVLPNNSQCYISENGSIQYADQSAVNSEQYVDPPNMNGQNIIQQQYSGEQLSMPVLEQITSEVLAESQNMEAVPNAVVQGQYTTNQNEMLEVPVENINFGEIEKISQCDELSTAVNSITQLCQQNNAGLESQFVGFLQQQPTAATPASSPSPNLSSVSTLQSASLGASPVISSPPSSQGITVVIGSGSQMTVGNVATQSSINMPVLTASLKKQTATVADATHLLSPGASTSSNRGITHVTAGSTIPHGSLHHSQHIQHHQQATQQQTHLQQIHIHPQQIQQEHQPQQQVQHHQIQHPSQQQTQHYQVQQTQHIQTQQQTHLQTQVQVHQQQQHHQPQHHQQQHTQHPTQHQQHQVQQQQHQQQTQSMGTMLTPAIPTHSPKKSTKKKKPGERKLVPLKDREYNPELHCGVVVAETGKPCTRSLTCKTHSLTLRRAVSDRSKKFDELLIEHRAAKEAQQKASRPPETAAAQFQVSFPLISFIKLCNHVLI